MKTFTIEEAAAYLDMKVSAVKYQFHTSQNLKGHRIGGNAQKAAVVLFTRRQLDDFRDKRHKVSGRPPRQVARVEAAIEQAGIEARVATDGAGRVKWVEQVVGDGVHKIKLDKAPSKMGAKALTANILRDAK
jgi:hypothetical protein